MTDLDPPTVDRDGSLSAERPAASWGPALTALWWAGRGDWERAHALVQADEHGADAAWVHAYLHRQEGDIANARYWYARAGQPVPTISVDAERVAIVDALQARGKTKAS